MCYHFVVNKAVYLHLNKFLQNSCIIATLLIRFLHLSFVDSVLRLFHLISDVPENMFIYKVVWWLRRKCSYIFLLAENAKNIVLDSAEPLT